MNWSKCLIAGIVPAVVTGAAICLTGQPALDVCLVMLTGFAGALAVFQMEQLDAYTKLDLYRLARWQREEKKEQGIE